MGWYWFYKNFSYNIKAMNTILLIEDDSGIILPLSLYIKKEWHNLITCEDGASAIDIFLKNNPNLIILDINLPNRSGIDICREIRSHSSVPIIVLSARDSETDKLQLFELWVDDYVSKPFSSRELMARISAVLKRSETKKKSLNKKILQFWPLILNVKNFTATFNGDEITFTKTEFSILEYFIKNSHNVIKRESLMKDVIGYDNYAYDRTIDTHIKNLRKKIGEKILIETVRWVGYRLEILSNTI